MFWSWVEISSFYTASILTVIWVQSVFQHTHFILQYNPENTETLKDQQLL